MILRNTTVVFVLETEPLILLHAAGEQEDFRPDRKSTRLNSSHRCISYAVFCLKKSVRRWIERAITAIAAAVHLGRAKDRQELAANRQAVKIFIIQRLPPR